MYLSSFFVSYDWVFLIIVIAFLLYHRATRYRNYWKNQDIPYEKLSLFFGAQWKQLFKPLHVADEELYKKHGRLFGSFEDGKPVLYVGDPDLLKVVLVKDAALTQRKTYKFDDSILDNLMTNVEPEQWRKLRTATSPAFTTGKLRKMQAIIDRCAALTSQRLQEAARESEDVDMKGFYGRFALDAVASCSFGTKLSPQSLEEGAFVSSARNAFFAYVTPSVVLKACIQKLSETFHKGVFNENAFNFYRDATVNIIKKRTENNIRKEDFLQMMLNAKEAYKEESTKTDESTLRSAFETAPVKQKDIKNLSEEEALAQCVLFFLAGQEASSTTASFVSYLLAVNPQVQDKLRSEVDECFRKHGGSPSYDEVQKLPYLDAVLNETLRMMSPAPRIERAPHQDYELGEAGIKVPRDCLIVIPVQAMHNDPEFFPEPHVFNPERFEEENAKSIRPYTFLPFGAGPRNCIGMRFAIQIVKTCLLHAVHQVEFVKTAKTKVPLEYLPGFGLLHPKSLVVGVRQRRS